MHYLDFISKSKNWLFSEKVKVNFGGTHSHLDNVFIFSNKDLTCVFGFDSVIITFLNLGITVLCFKSELRKN